MRFVALLRGINVGGHKRVPMAELRALCEELGWTNVASYIQSGNLVFDATAKAAALERTLEVALAERFGFEVTTLVRSARAMRALPATNPFTAAASETPKFVMLLLAKGALDERAAAALEPLAQAGEEVVQVPGALWLHLPKGSARSKWSPTVLDRCAGSLATTRNWNTLSKLVELL